MDRRKFLLSSSALLLAGCGGNTDPGPHSRFEAGRKYLFEDVPVAVLAGSWRQMGRQYGAFFADGIRATYRMVAPYEDQYNRGCGRMNRDIIEEIHAAYPQGMQQFFVGMAETSGLALDQVKAANALEMILIFGSGIYPQTRCSGVSVWGDYSVDKRLVYGRNYDYTAAFAALDEHVVVTVFHPDDGSIPFAICTWAGCIYASTGINARGIFVEENDCSQHDRLASGFYATGDHYNMRTWVRDDAMLMALLAGAGSMDEADTWMRANLPVYSHNIGVADSREARCYQWNVAERVPHAPYVRQTEGLMAQTNHYFQVPQGWELAPFSEGDGASGSIPGGSIARLNNLLNIAEGRRGAIDLDGMCALMDVEIGDGGARVDGTLFQIVCQPETLRLRLTTLKRRGRWIDIPLSGLLLAKNS
ncbi:C45 family autoproteolytic acyltransferase/hydolase [Noviherbaspirillum pedocola]|uniref:Uncharacterized protein n=1 Tax=Noviherbaspirillum pedocola TaxID=2801341 RepID=A0A934W6B4_9BURK|nr:C45 family peptidase [Noviherbaspirillum pedocola]MBK4734920.1 hypothetical protein [Noviherbaspirillum pedocola]